jgi:hypothetical protein
VLSIYAGLTPLQKNTINKHNIVTIWDPVTPIFFPNKPESIEPNKGKNNIVKYI